MYHALARAIETHESKAARETNAKQNEEEENNTNLQENVH